MASEASQVNMRLVSRPETSIEGIAGAGRNSVTGNELPSGMAVIDPLPHRSTTYVPLRAKHQSVLLGGSVSIQDVRDNEKALANVDLCSLSLEGLFSAGYVPYATAMQRARDVATGIASTTDTAHWAAAFPTRSAEATANVFNRGPPIDGGILFPNPPEYDSNPSPEVLQRHVLGTALCYNASTIGGPSSSEVFHFVMGELSHLVSKQRVAKAPGVSNSTSAKPTAVKTTQGPLSDDANPTTMLHADLSATSRRESRYSTSFYDAEYGFGGRGAPAADAQFVLSSLLENVAFSAAGGPKSDISHEQLYAAVQAVLGSKAGGLVPEMSYNALLNPLASSSNATAALSKDAFSRMDMHASLVRQTSFSPTPVHHFGHGFISYLFSLLRKRAAEELAIAELLQQQQQDEVNPNKESRHALNELPLNTIALVTVVVLARTHLHEVLELLTVLELFQKLLGELRKVRCDVTDSTTTASKANEAFVESIVTTALSSFSIRPCLADRAASATLNTSAGSGCANPTTASISSSITATAGAIFDGICHDPTALKIPLSEGTVVNTFCVSRDRRLVGIATNEGLSIFDVDTQTFRHKGGTIVFPSSSSNTAPATMARDTTGSSAVAGGIDLGGIDGVSPNASNGTIPPSFTGPSDMALPLGLAGGGGTQSGGGIVVPSFGGSNADSGSAASAGGIPMMGGMSLSPSTANHLSEGEGSPAPALAPVNAMPPISSTAAATSSPMPPAWSLQFNHDGSEILITAASCKTHTRVCTRTLEIINVYESETPCFALYVDRGTRCHVSMCPPASLRATMEEENVFCSFHPRRRRISGCLTPDLSYDGAGSDTMEFVDRSSRTISRDCSIQRQRHADSNSNLNDNDNDNDNGSSPQIPINNASLTPEMRDGGGHTQALPLPSPAVRFVANRRVEGATSFQLVGGVHAHSNYSGHPEGIRTTTTQNSRATSRQASSRRVVPTVFVRGRDSRSTSRDRQAQARNSISQGDDNDTNNPRGDDFFQRINSGVSDVNGMSNENILTSPVTHSRRIAARDRASSSLGRKDGKDKGEGGRAQEEGHFAIMEAPLLPYGHLHEATLFCAAADTSAIHMGSRASILSNACVSLPAGVGKTPLLVGIDNLRIAAYVHEDFLGTIVSFENLEAADENIAIFISDNVLHCTQGQMTCIATLPKIPSYPWRFLCVSWEAGTFTVIVNGCAIPMLLNRTSPTRAISCKTVHMLACYGHIANVSVWTGPLRMSTLHALAHTKRFATTVAPLWGSRSSASMRLGAAATPSDLYPNNPGRRRRGVADSIFNGFSSEEENGAHIEASSDGGVFSNADDDGLGVGMSRIVPIAHLPLDEGSGIWVKELVSQTPHVLLATSGWDTSEVLPEVLDVNALPPSYASLKSSLWPAYFPAVPGTSPNDTLPPPPYSPGEESDDEDEDEGNTSTDTIKSNGGRIHDALMNIRQPRRNIPTPRGPRNDDERIEAIFDAFNSSTDDSSTENDGIEEERGRRMRGRSDSRKSSASRKSVAKVMPHHVRLPAAILLGSRLVHSKYQTVLIAPMARPGADMLLTIAQHSNVIEHIAFTPHVADTTFFLDYNDAFCYAYQQRFFSFTSAKMRTVYQNADALKRWMTMASKLGYPTYGEEQHDEGEGASSSKAAEERKGSKSTATVVHRLSIGKLIEALYAVIAIEAFEIARAPRHLTRVSAQSVHAVVKGLAACDGRTPFVKVLAFLRLAMVHFRVASATSEHEVTKYARHISPSCRKLMAIFTSGPIFVAASSLFRHCVRVSQSPLQKAEILSCATDGQNKSIVIGYLALPSICEIIYSILPSSSDKALRMFESLLRACCREFGCEWSDGEGKITGGVGGTKVVSGNALLGPSRKSTDALNGSMPPATTVAGPFTDCDVNEATATTETITVAPGGGPLAPQLSPSLQGTQGTSESPLQPEPAPVGVWDEADASHEPPGIFRRIKANKGKGGPERSEGESITQSMLWFVLSFVKCGMQCSNTIIIAEALRLTLHATKRIVSTNSGEFCDKLQRSLVQTVLLPLIYEVSTRCPAILAESKDVTDELLALFKLVSSSMLTSGLKRDSTADATNTAAAGTLPTFSSSAGVNVGGGGEGLHNPRVAGGGIDGGGESLDLMLDSLTFNSTTDFVSGPDENPPSSSTMRHERIRSNSLGAFNSNTAAQINLPPLADGVVGGDAVEGARLSEESRQTSAGRGAAGGSLPSPHQSLAGDPPPSGDSTYKKNTHQKATLRGAMGGFKNRTTMVAFNNRQAIDVRPPTPTSDWRIVLDCTQCFAVTLARDGASELSVVCVTAAGESVTKRLIPREPSLRLAHGGTLFVTGVGAASLTLVKQFRFFSDPSWVAIARDCIRKAIVAVAHHMLAVPAGLDVPLAPVCRGGLSDEACRRRSVPILALTEVRKVSRYANTDDQKNPGANIRETDDKADTPKIISRTCSGEYEPRVTNDTSATYDMNTLVDAFASPLVRKEEKTVASAFVQSKAGSSVLSPSFAQDVLYGRAEGKAFADEVLLTMRSSVTENMKPAFRGMLAVLLHCGLPQAAAEEEAKARWLSSEWATKLQGEDNASSLRGVVELTEWIVCNTRGGPLPCSPSEASADALSAGFSVGHRGSLSSYSHSYTHAQTPMGAGGSTTSTSASHRRRVSDLMGTSFGDGGRRHSHALNLSASRRAHRSGTAYPANAYSISGEIMEHIRALFAKGITPTQLEDALVGRSFQAHSSARALTLLEQLLGVSDDQATTGSVLKALMQVPLGPGQHYVDPFIGCGLGLEYGLRVGFHSVLNKCLSAVKGRWMRGVRKNNGDGAITNSSFMSPYFAASSYNAKQRLVGAAPDGRDVLCLLALAVQNWDATDCDILCGWEPSAASLAHNIKPTNENTDGTKGKKTKGKAAASSSKSLPDPVCGATGHSATVTHPTLPKDVTAKDLDTDALRDKNATAAAIDLPSFRKSSSSGARKAHPHHHRRGTLEETQQSKTTETPQQQQCPARFSSDTCEAFAEVKSVPLLEFLKLILQTVNSSTPLAFTSTLGQGLSSSDNDDATNANTNNTAGKNNVSDAFGGGVGSPQQKVSGEIYDPQNSISNGVNNPSTALPVAGSTAHGTASYSSFHSSTSPSAPSALVSAPTAYTYALPPSPAHQYGKAYPVIHNPSELPHLLAAADIRSLSRVMPNGFRISMPKAFINILRSDRGFHVERLSSPSGDTTQIKAEDGWPIEERAASAMGMPRVFYYEVTLADSISRCGVGIVGAFEGDVILSFDACEYDSNGQVACYPQSSSPKVLPHFGEHDTVGCGYIPSARRVFFTLNGLFLGFFELKAPTSVTVNGPGLLYPTITRLMVPDGSTSGGKLFINFGASPFQFDFRRLHPSIHLTEPRLASAAPYPSAVPCLLGNDDEDLMAAANSHIKPTPANATLSRPSWFVVGDAALSALQYLAARTASLHTSKRGSATVILRQIAKSATSESIGLVREMLRSSGAAFPTDHWWRVWRSLHTKTDDEVPQRESKVAVASPSEAKNEEGSASTEGEQQQHQDAHDNASNNPVNLDGSSCSPAEMFNRQRPLDALETPSYSLGGPSDPEATPFLSAGAVSALVLNSAAGPYSLLPDYLRRPSGALSHTQMEGLRLPVIGGGGIQGAEGNATGLPQQVAGTPSGLGVGLTSPQGSPLLLSSGAAGAMESFAARVENEYVADRLAFRCLEAMLLGVLSVVQKVLTAPSYAVSSTEGESAGFARSAYGLLTHLLYVPSDSVRLAALRLLPMTLPVLNDKHISKAASELLVAPVYEHARLKDSLEPIRFSPMFSRCEIRNVSLMNSTTVKMNQGAQRSIVTGSVLPRHGTVSFSVRITRERMTSGHSLKGGYFIGVCLATLAPLSPTNNSQSWKLIKPPVVWALHDTSPQLAHAVNPTVRPNNFQRTFGSNDFITVVVNRDKGTVGFYRNGEFLKELFNELPNDMDLSPFVQMYNDDASAVLYPGEITPSSTPSGIIGAYAIDALRGMLTVKPFEAAVAAKLRSEMEIERLPRVTLSVFGSLPDVRYQVYLRSPNDEGTVVVREMSTTRVKFSVGDAVYYEDAQHMRLPANPDVRGPPEVGASPSSSVAGICSVVEALTESLSRVALPLVCEAAVASLEARNRQLILQEENDTRLTLHANDRIRAFLALHDETRKLTAPYLPLVAPPARYAFSAPLSHPGFVFPPTYCCRLGTVPTGSAHSETPFIAIAEPAIPSTGKFSIRCQLIRGHHGQILGGGYYFGVCLPSLLRRRRDMNMSPPDVWALHDMDDTFWRLKHILPEKKLPVASDPNCVLVSGDIIRLEIDREARTMVAFRQPANATEEIGLGVIFDNLPREGDLYPFVHLYNFDAVAILLPPIPRTPLVRTSVQQQRMAPSISEKLRSCDGCISQHRDTKLHKPHWFKCNECADYNLCSGCFYQYAHNGHTFTQMDPEMLLFSAAPPERLTVGQQVVVSGAPVEFLSSSVCSIDSHQFNNLAVAKGDDAHAIWGLSAFTPTFTATVEPGAKAEAFPFNRPVFIGIAPMDVVERCSTEMLRNACLLNASSGEAASGTASTVGDASKATEELASLVVSHCSDSRIRPRMNKVALKPYGFQCGSTITLTVQYSNESKGEGTVMIYRDWTLVGSVPLPSSVDEQRPLAGFVLFSSKGSRASVDVPLSVTVNATVTQVINNSMAIVRVGSPSASTPSALPTNRIVHINNCRARLQPLTIDKARALLDEPLTDISNGPNGGEDSIVQPMVMILTERGIVPCKLTGLNPADSSDSLMVRVSGSHRSVSRAVPITSLYLSDVRVERESLVIAAGSGGLGPLSSVGHGGLGVPLSITGAPSTDPPHTYYYNSTTHGSASSCGALVGGEESTSVGASAGGPTFGDGFVISRVLLTLVTLLDERNLFDEVSKRIERLVGLVAQLASVPVANDAPFSYVKDMRAAIASTARLARTDMFDKALGPLIPELHFDSERDSASETALLTVVAGPMTGCIVRVTSGTTGQQSSPDRRYPKATDGPPLCRGVVVYRPHERYDAESAALGERSAEINGAGLKEAIVASPPSTEETGTATTAPQNNGNDEPDAAEVKHGEKTAGCSLELSPLSPIHGKVTPTKNGLADTRSPVALGSTYSSDGAEEVTLDLRHCVPSLQCGSSPWWSVPDGLSASYLEHAMRENCPDAELDKVNLLRVYLDGEWHGELTTDASPNAPTTIVSFSLRYEEGAVVGTAVVASDSRGAMSCTVTGRYHRYQRRVVLTLAYDPLSTSEDVRAAAKRHSVTWDEDVGTAEMADRVRQVAASTSIANEDAYSPTNGGTASSAAESLKSTTQTNAQRHFPKTEWSLIGLMDAEGMKVQGTWRCGSGGVNATKGSFNITSLRGISLARNRGDQQRRGVFRAVPPLGDLEEPAVAAVPSPLIGPTLRRLAVLLSRHLLVLFVTRCPSSPEALRYRREVIRYHAHPYTKHFIASQRDQCSEDYFTVVCDAVGLIKAPSSRPWDLPTLAKIITVGLALQPNVSTQVPAVYWDAMHSLVTAAHACGSTYRSDLITALIQLVRLGSSSSSSPPSALIDLLGALLAWVDRNTLNPLARVTQRDVAAGIELIMAIPQDQCPVFSSLPLSSFHAAIEIARCLKFGRPLPRIMDKLGRLVDKFPEVSVRCPFGTFVEKDRELRVGKTMSVQRIRVGAGGKYYYEVVMPEKLATYAIGWGTVSHQHIPSQHVGSDVHSFAFCGSQVLSKGFKEEYKFPPESSSQSSTVVGVLIDLNERVAAWSINGSVGRTIPIPIRDLTDDVELCAFISTGSCGGLKINMTATEFAFAPDGYVDLNGSTLRAQIQPFTMDEPSIAAPKPVSFYARIVKYMTAKAAKDVARRESGASSTVASSSMSSGIVGGIANSSLDARLQRYPSLATPSIGTAAVHPSHSAHLATAGVQHLDPTLTLFSPSQEHSVGGLASSATAGVLSPTGLQQQRRPVVSFQTPDPENDALLAAHQLTGVSPSDLVIYSSHVRVIESCFNTVSRYIDLESDANCGALAAAFKFLRPAISEGLRAKLIEITALDKTDQTPPTIIIRTSDRGAPFQRSPEATVQMSVLGQLHKQLTPLIAAVAGKGNNATTNNTNTTNASAAAFFSRTPLFKVSLFLTGSHHSPQDAGGPYRQVWTQLTEELMRHPDSCYPHTDQHRNPLFRFINNTRRVAIVPDSDRTSAYDESLFYLFGQLMGHMARARTPLAFDASAFMWKFLVEEPLTIRDYYDEVDSVVEQSIADDIFFTMELAHDVIPGFAEAVEAVESGKVSADYFFIADADRDDPLREPSTKGTNTNKQSSSSAGTIKSLRKLSSSKTPSTTIDNVNANDNDANVSSGGDAQVRTEKTLQQQRQQGSNKPRVSRDVLSAAVVAVSEDVASITGPESLLSLGGSIVHDKKTDHDGARQPPDALPAPLGNNADVARFEGSAAPHTSTDSIVSSSSSFSQTSSSSSQDALPIATQRAIAEHCLLHSMDAQMGAIREGMWSVLPRKVTRCMCWHGLEAAVCGDPSPSVAKLREAFIVLLNAPRDEYFWSIVEEMTGEQRSSLICFASGQKRLPLVKKIRVAESTESLAHLPRAQSCSSLIVIPMYNSYESMKQKLLMAISHTGEMELA